MKKVFLDDLSKWGKGEHGLKGIINWKESVGNKVKFEYDDIKGEIEIINYISKIHCLYIKYLDKPIFKISTGHFMRCQFGKLLDKYTDKFKVEIGYHFKDNNRDLIIIDRKIKKNKSNKIYKYYRYRCNKCGFECDEHYKNGEYKEELWIEESNLLTHEKGCACCCSSPQIVVENINSIVSNKETHWMIPYFQGEYNEAKLYNKSSGHKIFARCPDCGKIKDKSMTINTIYENHSIGCNCSDGKSYPSKIMFNVLKQLSVNFEVEFSPNWIKPKRYDFYFELDNNKYIIETDGGWHGKDNTINGQTKKESQTIDDYKDKLADEHGVEVIRIDCYESELEYIKGNILDSQLKELFDLSKINWLQAEEFALSNLCKKACEIKRDNPNMTTTEIGETMGLSNVTIKNYLKKGSRLNWCEYNIEKEILRRREKAMKSLIESCSKQVEIFDKDGKSLGIFESCSELEKQSEKLFGVKLNHSHISNVCYGKRKSHKGFIFCYIDKSELKEVI